MIYMDENAPKPTVFTNVELPAYGNPDCPDCHGKGFVGIKNSEHTSNSVTPCERCCKHETKTKDKKWCRECGKNLLETTPPSPQNSIMEKQTA